MEKFMKTKFLIFALILAVAAPLALADEGMWLFNAFPKEKVKAQYGFLPTQQWLDHVRLSSVRFNNGGSGSFVSADGLTFTNHHVGADCIQKLSKAGTDYMKTGFYAKTQADEARCPDLELNVLTGIEDVTGKVNASGNAGMSAAEAGQAQRAAMSAIEKDCTTSTGMRCDVVTLYSGEAFHLYKYKKYTDVRLVFAPEFDAAFFGGDPDNFTYPRYDLDITFFRIYENDKPVHLDNYLKWSKNGVQDGELIFVSGHPGGTDRLKTMAQMQYLKDVDYPARLANYKRRIALFEKFAGESAENARIAQEDLFGYQNSQKAITGYFEGLRDEAEMARKSGAERDQTKQYMDKHAQGPNPWDDIAKAMTVEREIYGPLTYVERLRGFNSDLAQYARWIVRAAEEKPKPNGDRLREYRDSALPSLEQKLFSSAPVYKNFETVLLGDSLAQMQDALGADNAAVKAALGGKSSDEVAKEVIGGTKLDDPAVRKQLYEGGKAVVEASADPLIVLMRNVDPAARGVRKRYDDEVDAVERRDGAIIAKARFEQSGFNQPPDATFTLRLSYGAAKGYEENGKKIPYFTNIGGNSGSPTINKSGEVVGIIFDGNIQSLVWNFFFDERQGRAVSVDSRGIIEALRKVYGANALADELTGAKAPTK